MPLGPPGRPPPEVRGLKRPPITCQWVSAVSGGNDQTSCSAGPQPTSRDRPGLKALAAGRRGGWACCYRQMGFIRPIEFIELSLEIHQVNASWGERPAAMKENIVIPIKIERLKVWAGWTLEAATWLICLGLLAASLVVAACAGLAWLMSGSETFLTIGLGGGLLLGLAGVWHWLRQLDRTVQQLRRGPPTIE